MIQAAVFFVTVDDEGIPTSVLKSPSKDPAEITVAVTGETDVIAAFWGWISANDEDEDTKIPLVARAAVNRLRGLTFRAHGPE